MKKLIVILILVWLSGYLTGAAFGEELPVYTNADILAMMYEHGTVPEGLSSYSTATVVGEAVPGEIKCAPSGETVENAPAGGSRPSVCIDMDAPMTLAEKLQMYNEVMEKNGYV